MKQTQLTWHDVERYTQALCRGMTLEQWCPDYVVGLTRGGLTPAVMVSQYFNIPMYTLKVSLRDAVEDCESNLWMAEEAFGYVNAEDRAVLNCRWDPALRKKILILDDINDSGATFNWIQDDWQSSCMPAETGAWATVWNHNVRFAVLVNNETSGFKAIDYSALTVNKLEDPQWVIFPWEEFWLNRT